MVKKRVVGCLVKSRGKVSNIWGTILKVEEVSFSGGKVFSGRVGFKVANISQVRF